MPDKKLITKKVNFPSLQKIVDDNANLFIEHFKLSEVQGIQMREGLKRLLDSFLTEFQYAAELGAKKGIEEAVLLMQDPDYYLTVKKRDENSRKRNKEWKEKMEEEAAERKYRLENPTTEDLKRLIKTEIYNLVSSKEQYNSAREKIEILIEKNGKNILLQTLKEKYRLPDFFAENFDLDSFIEELKLRNVSDGQELDNFFDGHEIIQ